MTVEQSKDLMMRAHAKELRAQHPSWSFGRCWAVALEQHPDLAEEFSDDDTALKSVTTSSHLKTALSDFLPQKVQAIDDDKPVLVYGAPTLVQASHHQIDEREGANLSDEEKDKLIQAKIRSMREAKPYLSRTAAYSQLAHQMPWLFGDRSL